MPDHPNVVLVRNLFAAFERADLAEIQTVIPEHAVWHFPGHRGKLAGAHEGRDAILAFLIDVTALSSGTFHLELEDVLANDRYAVALFRGHGQRDGKTLDNPTCLKMRIESGKILEVWEFVWDLYAVDEFWS
jgi:ketosteroid isomerase-like protein